MTHRSLFLPNESFSDVQDKLSHCKTDDELRHAMSERLKQNGWSREKEEVFRDNAAACGFILPSSRPKSATVETPIADRYKTRLPPGAVGHALRNEGKEREILPDQPEQD